MKRILMTGTCGFIGGHFLEEALSDPQVELTCLVGLTYAGDANYLSRLPNFDPVRVRMIYHDLRAEVSESLIKQIGPQDYIVNIASQSHVDRSIEDPVPFFMGNCALAVNMLELARKIRPQKFIQISTDEVFGPAADGYSHKEWDPHIPSNPYAASKGAQEDISIAYWRTYGVPLIITNTMNNYGPRQNEEKFIPKIIKAAYTGETINVHGEWVNETSWRSGSRVWLHARHHAEAIMWLINNVDPEMYAGGATKPTRFNVAGFEETSNLELLRMVEETLDIQIQWRRDDFHASRAGHDLRYSLCSKKLRDAGFKPSSNFRDSFRETVLTLASELGYEYIDGIV